MPPGLPYLVQPLVQLSLELPLGPPPGSRLLGLFRKIMSHASQCCRGQGEEEWGASGSGSMSRYTD